MDRVERNRDKGERWEDNKKMRGKRENRLRERGEQGEKKEKK